MPAFDPRTDTRGAPCTRVIPTAIREYDERAPDPAETETATFALGCFWGPDARFGAMEGVVRTRVGYAGGTTTDPTYHALGDHTEAFQVEFDPEAVSFRDLLERVFRSHDPNRQTSKTQYQNVVFAGDADQRAVVDDYLADRGLDADAIGTRVERLDRFYLAEPYHQKYNLKGTPSVVDVFEDADYDDATLRESPAAAKLNGFASGHDVPDARELGVGEGATAGRDRGA
jgi:peptide-methionine (S)-S-oxide reductase